MSRVLQFVPCRRIAIGRKLVRIFDAAIVLYFSNSTHSYLIECGWELFSLDSFYNKRFGLVSSRIESRAAMVQAMARGPSSCTSAKRIDFLKVFISATAQIEGHF